jgi:hypothetical protein
LQPPNEQFKANCTGNRAGLSSILVYLLGGGKFSLSKFQHLSFSKIKKEKTILKR